MSATDVPSGSGSERRYETPRPAIAWLTPERRRWLYLVLTAAVPLLIIYGVISTESAPLWIALAGAVLGTTTAAVHTPRIRKS